ncbi:MAG: TIGR03960 family B12-binding radical SAM protein [Deltaproteobacteria bacterium]|nr:TIGR03960 family B12-binding radical SAM protein [Deltaproteobacteria bacterium]
MKDYDYNDILRRVRGPGQYAGGEVGSVCKDPAQLQARFLLAYPDLYEIGMSYLGTQVLYALVNAEADLAAERVFAPALDMEQALRKAGLPLVSLESRSPMADFDAVGFTLQHELNYPDILVMLEMGGIPWRADERSAAHPVILAGGPGAANPEPLAPALDVVVLGDAEDVLPELLRRLGAARRDGAPRSAQLDAIADLTGVYLPGRYRIRYAPHGAVEAIEPLAGVPERVRRAVVADLDRVPPPERLLVASSRTIHDRLAVEIQRGCTRGCRFCQAGMINRPVRQRSVGKILQAVRDGLRISGHDQVSFLSLSAGDHARILDLLAAFFSEHAEMRIAASLPSLRAETLTAELAELVRTVRKSGFTIAPEAGSDRIRRVINKDLEQADILAAATGAFAAGWRLLKLYFMVGLPTEQPEDHQAIVDLVNEVRRALIAAGHKPQINVGISTFVPKPHTPFQWEAMLTPDASRRIHDGLRGNLRRLGGVKVGWTLSELSWAEGLLSRGDRRQFEALCAIAKSGARLASWNEHFQHESFRQAFDEVKVPGGVDAFYLGSRNPGQLLPWSHLDMGPEEDFLLQERKQALEIQPTPDCLTDVCSNCGACPKGLQPLPDLSPLRVSEPQALQCEVEKGDAVPIRLRMRLSKRAPSSWLGHLEFMRSVHRSLRRAQWPLAFTEGFHPKIKSSFGPPCPSGAESSAEWMDVWLTDCDRPEDLMAALELELPKGVALQEWHMLEADAKALTAMARKVRYRIHLHGVDEKQAKRGCEEMMARESWSLVRTVKKKRKRVELRPSLLGLVVEPGEQGLDAVLDLDMKSASTARPSEVAAEVFGLSLATILREVIEFEDAPVGSGT